MKKITLFLFIAVICNINAQQITLIDFGLPDQTTAGNWNNVTDSGTLNSSTNLIDNSGATTGEVLTLTDVFDDQINGIGTTSPDGSLPFPSSATRDNFFGEDVDFTDGASGSTISNEPTGGFTLSGLEAGKYYSFKIFASRTGVSDNRETLYTVTGIAGPQTATLDAANNTANVVSISNVQPNGSGEITIQAEKGPNNTNSFGFYYIGSIEMTKTDTTLSADSFGIRGLVNIYPNPATEYINISLSLNQAAHIKINLYDLTGKIVKTILDEKKLAGSFIETWNKTDLSSGTYILEIDADGRKHNSKLILK
jgi:hypothetical protein